jgi:hypothetical protein
MPRSVDVELGGGTRAASGNEPTALGGAVLRHVTGTRMRRSVFDATNREAAAKLRKALTAKDEGRVLPSAPDTVELFLRGWVDGQKPNLRPGTTLMERRPSSSSRAR